jgi:hypothetical protein
MCGGCEKESSVVAEMMLKANVEAIVDEPQRSRPCLEKIASLVVSPLVSSPSHHCSALSRLFLSVGILL